MKTLAKILIKTLKWFLILSVVVVFIFKWAPVRYTLQMVRSSAENWGDEKYTRCQSWIPIERTSTVFKKTVISSMDRTFYTHNGFIKGGSDADIQRRRNGRMCMSACVSISQQVSRNLFTFGTNTWIRKGIETWFTFLIEKIWGKDRILEVYINVADFGNGIYGVQAASKHYFSTEASELTTAESERLILYLN